MMIEPLPLIDIGGVWHILIFAALSLTSIYGIFRPFFNSLPLSIKLLGAYIFISAIFILEYPAIHFGPYTPNYQATAGQAAIELMLLPISIYFLMSWMEERIIPALTAITILAVWFKQPGLLNAVSFNTAFLALMLPFVIDSWLWPVSMFTVLTHHGSTALVIVAVQTAYAVMLLKKGIARVSIITLVILIFVLVAYLNSGHAFDSGERLQHYREYFVFWLQHWRWMVFGVGPGSFIWTSIMLRMKTGMGSGFFLQMHSDWLQILWENGIIGLGLALWTFIDALFLALRAGEDDIVAALLGTAAFGITYHPLRFYPTCAVVLYAFIRAFNCKIDSLQARPLN